MLHRNLDDTRMLCAGSSLILPLPSIAVRHKEKLQRRLPAVGVCFRPTRRTGAARGGLSPAGCRCAGLLSADAWPRRLPLSQHDVVLQQLHLFVHHKVTRVEICTL